MKMYLYSKETNHVVCLVCNKKLHQGSIHSHLKTHHNLSIAQYRKQFDIPVQSNHGRGGPSGCVPHNKKYETLHHDISCHICSKSFQILTTWYHNRLRKGKDRFACSMECKKKLQAITIKEVRSTLESRAKTVAQLNQRWSDPAERARYGAIIKAKPLEWHQRRLAKTLSTCLKSPTKPEQQVIDAIKQHGLPFKYVGDGQLWIGRLNPDFVATDGSRRVVDMHGCYWHGCQRCFPGSKAKGIPFNQRLSTYRKHGYIPTVIWQHELKNPSFLRRSGMV